jgi:hypothetical protein
MKKLILLCLFAQSVVAHAETITVSDTQASHTKTSHNCHTSKNIAAVLGIAGLMGISSGITWFIVKGKMLARLFKNFKTNNDVFSFCENGYDLGNINVIQSGDNSIFTVQPPQSGDFSTKQAVSKKLCMLYNEAKHASLFLNTLEKVELTGPKDNRAVVLTFAS